MMDEIVIDEQKQIQIFLPRFMRCNDLVYVMVMIMNINIKQITIHYTHITYLSKTFCKIVYADLFSNTES